MNPQTTDAYKETIRRYPHAVDALVFFATAAGLFQTQLDADALIWAGQYVSTKPGAINEVADSTLSERTGVTPVIVTSPDTTPPPLV